MKKILSLVLSVLLVLGGLLSAFAAETETPDAGQELPENVYETVPESFANAQVLNLRAFEAANETAGSQTYWPWNSGDFSLNGTEYTPLGKDTVLYAGSRDFVYNITFTPEMAGEYDFAVFVANRVTTNGSSSSVKENPAVGAFEITLKNGETLIDTYTLTERTPGEVASKLYYVIAEDVSLEAGVTYTVGFRNPVASDTALVDFLYVTDGMEPDVSDEPDVPDEPAEPIVLVGSSELPAEFADADTLHFADFEDANADLVKSGEGDPWDYNVFAKDHAYGNAVIVLPGVKYAVPFTVDAAGTYEFCISHYVRDEAWNNIYWHGGQVQIDDGAIYDLNEKDTTNLTKNAVGYFTGITEELEAGEHTLYLIGTRPNGLTAYFLDAYYYTEDGEDAPVAGVVVTETLPEVFEGAEQFRLFDVYDAVNANGDFPAGQVLYTFSTGNLAAQGIENMNGVMPFAGCEYPLAFTVDASGKYQICVVMANYQVAGNATVKIYDENGQLLCEDILELASDAPNDRLYYYTLSEEFTLTAGSTYTAKFTGSTTAGATGNSIICYLACGLVEAIAEPEPPVVPDPEPPVEPDPKPPVEPVSTTLAAAGKDLPSAFASATRLHFLDYVADNRDLTPPSGNTPGDYITYPDSYGGAVGVFNGAKYAVTFYVPSAGVYEFCIKNYVRSDDTWGSGNYDPATNTTKYPHPGTVQIDDGIVYTVTAQALLDINAPVHNGPYHFTGMRVELTAGTHTLYLSGNKGNGANPYFISAYYYCAERTDVYEDIPLTGEDVIDATDCPVDGVNAPASITVSNNGIFNIYATVHAGSEPSIFTVKIGDKMYTVYEMDGLAAGTTRIYEIARGVELSAGTHTVSIGQLGGVTPDVTELYFLMTDYAGVTEEHPFPDATATIQTKASTAGSGLNEAAGGSTWYNFGVNDSGSDQGGIRPQGSYTYKFNVEVPSDGTFSIAAYIDHAWTGALNLKFNGKTYTINPIDVTGMRYYVLDESVALEAGTYTAELSRADGTTSALFNSLILSADEIDGISDTTPVGFENGTVVHIQSQIGSSANAGGSFFTWGGNEFAMGGYPALGKNAVWLVSTEFEYSVTFTPAETDAYSLALYLANRTNTNGHGAGSVLLPNPRAGAFVLTLKDAAGTVIGTYELEELAPKLGSRLYYTFAEDVALEAGAEYTLGIPMSVATDSTLVDVLFEKTSVVEAAKEAAKEDEESGAGGIPVAVIIPAPNMNITDASDALGQPHLNVINPIAAPAESVVADGEKSGNAPAPKQPHVPANKPAAPSKPGNHYATPARPA